MTSGLHRRPAPDAGLTLVELLVAIVLTGILGGVVVTVLLGIHTSVSNSNAQHNLNEEARLALNRIARELRQATAITKPAGFASPSAITSVQNPDGADYDPTQITTVTFTSDFNGDGCIDGVNSSGTATGCSAYNANDPETLTYCWDPSSDVRELFLIPGQFVGPTCQTSGAQAILAGDVTSFKLSYRSNAYLADANNDGITTWTELDAHSPSLGNDDGTLDAAELPEIDSVVIDITASEAGSHSQSYTTEVDLRNVS
ncbi:MAG TPA: prepilin-type N-terminal cleavage/methylation domain-containing protein [Mycobacteriales bacterium]|nr:prepilin-type N-terminal cleavage/methylation domain-containing protein [Mycobacteriales bacterium]